VRAWTLIACVFALLLAPLSGARQKDNTPIDVRLLALDGRRIQLDAGRAAQVAAGDHVVLQPVAGTARDAIVRSVTQKTCWAELVGPVAGIQVGIEGQILVPSSRLKAKADSPAHPPWSQDLDLWNREAPLLSKPPTSAPSSRSYDLHGRVWTNADWSFDNQRQGNDSGRARLGLSADWIDPFEQGGALQLELRALDRWSDGSGGPGADEMLLGLERASYATGGTAREPVRVEYGRFLQHEFPELGLLDGVEYTRRLDSGSHLGASAGFLPDFTPERRTGDDQQVSVYYKYTSGPERTLELGSALQKTWHEGSPDRDLLLGTLLYRPLAPLTLRGGVWIDLYDSGDAPKSSGMELSQGQLSASYFGSKSGASLGLSRYRWPVLLRNELPPLLQEDLASGQVDRTYLSSWHRFDGGLRLSGRVDRWQDEDSDGHSGELRIASQDTFISQGEVSAAVTWSEAQFSRLNGLRFGAWRSTSLGTWRLDLLLSEQTPAGADSFGSSTLRASWDQSFYTDWQLSLHAQQSVGDEQDSTYLGFTLTRSF
jgi:hypothetical protein